METFLNQAALLALFQVILIDLALAGDNAVVIGLAAAGLPKEQRPKAIMVGMIVATIFRIIFALLAVQLLRITGIQFAGGILLLWVCWKMWGELRAGDQHDEINITKPKTFKAAIWQIVIADVSMSLDNVLATAGAAREHPSVLVFGLILSIAMMGFAANFIAGLLSKHRWIGYLGLGIIVYVAITMIYHGGEELLTLAR